MFGKRIIIILVILMLTGCSAKKIEQIEQTFTSTSITPEDKQVSENKINSETNTITTTSIVTVTLDEDIPTKNSIINFINKYVTNNDEEKYNFWITDFNEDGEKELFVGSNGYAIKYDEGEVNLITSIYILYDGETLKVKKYHDTTTNQNFCLYEELNDQGKTKYTGLSAFNDEFSYYFANSQNKPLFSKIENTDEVNYYLSKPISERYEITDIIKPGGDDNEVIEKVYTNVYNQFMSELEPLPMNITYKKYSLQEINEMTDDQWIEFWLG